MAGREYATIEQVKALSGIDLWVGPSGDPVEIEADAHRRILRASRLIDQMLATAWYDTDETTGMPTDQRVADALAEAVAYQIEWFEETGDDTGVMAGGGGSIGSVSLPSTPGVSSTPGSRNLARWAPDAVATLRSAPGITWGVMS